MSRNCLSQCVRVGWFEMVVRRELTELTSVGSWIRTSLCSFVTVPSEDVYIVSEARKRAGSSYGVTYWRLRLFQPKAKAKSKHGRQVSFNSPVGSHPERCGKESVKGERAIRKMDRHGDNGRSKAHAESLIESR